MGQKNRKRKRRNKYKSGIFFGELTMEFLDQADWWHDMSLNAQYVVPYKMFMQTNIICPRCGLVHEEALPMHAFEAPIRITSGVTLHTYTHWYLCPTKKEPALLQLAKDAI